MTASSTSRHRPDDTPCRVEAAASLARATRSPIHLARSVHPANLMALRPQLRFARSAPAIPPSQPRPTRPTPPARAPEARPHHESPQRPVRCYSRRFLLRSLADRRERSQPERTRPEGPPSSQSSTSPGTTSSVSAARCSASEPLSRLPCWGCCTSPETAVRTGRWIDRRHATGP
jgi:hypothetical protein